MKQEWNSYLNISNISHFVGGFFYEKYVFTKSLANDGENAEIFDMY